MEHLEFAPTNTNGYRTVPGKPSPTLVAVALTPDCRVVFGPPKGQPYRPPSTSPPPNTYDRLRAGGVDMGHSSGGAAALRSMGAITRFGMMEYDDEVERQRRLLCDSVLGQMAYQRPRYVQPVVDRVGSAVQSFWQRVQSGAADKTIRAIVAGAGTRLYTKTSFGRRDQEADENETLAAFSDNPLFGASDGDGLRFRVGQWFQELTRAPRDIPRLMSLYDFFYCKVFDLIPGGKNLPEWKRAELKKAVWRPRWYEEKGPRGRAEVRGTVKTTTLPGLLTEDFTIPNPMAAFRRCNLGPRTLKREDRKRGFDSFSIQTRLETVNGVMILDTGNVLITSSEYMNEEFRSSLAEHNLPFSAGASGTTSTLFLAAEAFAGISSLPLEAKRQYLLACVAYLVAGGMHTCHEVFWTGRLVGVPVTEGKYLDTLPDSFKNSLDFDKWTAEFWEIVRPDRTTVR